MRDERIEPEGDVVNIEKGGINPSSSSSSFVCSVFL